MRLRYASHCVIRSVLIRGSKRVEIFRVSYSKTVIFFAGSGYGLENQKHCFPVSGQKHVQVSIMIRVKVTCRYYKV